MGHHDWLKACSLLGPPERKGEVPGNPEDMIHTRGLYLTKNVLSDLQ
jgi:hypothetical protein